MSSGILGYKRSKMVDECGINGSSLDEAVACKDVLNSFITVPNIIDCWVLTAR